MHLSIFIATCTIVESLRRHARFKKKAKTINQVKIYHVWSTKNCYVPSYAHQTNTITEEPAH